MNPKPDTAVSPLTSPTLNTFTRRTFMKTSALTVGAVTLLSQGKALAEEGGGSSSSDLWIYALRCDGVPSATDPGSPYKDGIDQNNSNNDMFRQSTTTEWDGGDNAVRLVQRASGPKIKTDDDDVFLSAAFHGAAFAFQDDDADDGTPFSSDDIVSEKTVATGHYKLKLEIVDRQPICTWTPASTVVSGTETESSLDPEAGDMTIATAFVPAARMASSVVVEVDGKGGGIGIAIVNGSFNFPSFQRKAELDMSWEIAVVRKRADTSEPWRFHDYAKKFISSAS